MQAWAHRGHDEHAAGEEEEGRPLQGAQHAQETLADNEAACTCSRLGDTAVCAALAWQVLSLRMGCCAAVQGPDVHALSATDQAKAEHHEQHLNSRFMHEATARPVLRVSRGLTCTGAAHQQPTSCELGHIPQGAQANKPVACCSLQGRACTPQSGRANLHTAVKSARRTHWWAAQASMCPESPYLEGPKTRRRPCRTGMSAPG